MQGINQEYFLYFVPKKDLMCENMLEQQGIYASTTILTFTHHSEFSVVSELPIYLLAMEPDLLSLELDSVYRYSLLRLVPTIH